MLVNLTSLGIDQRGIIELAGGASLFGLAAARHMPLPYEDKPLVVCWFFDTVQDLTKNNDRIGQRRSRTAIPNDESPKAR